MTVNDNNDYKHVMQDLEHYYIGSRLSYEEILASPLIPFKLQSIARKYLTENIDLSTSLESHLYYMTKEGEDYRTYRHLKVKVVCMLREGTKGASAVYKEKKMTVSDLVKMSSEEKKEKELIITEVVFGKLALMMFQI